MKGSADTTSAKRANTSVVKVLGIESSCDETAAAVVTEDGEVLSNVIASQIDVHAMYGGVVPELASRHHLRNLIPVLSQALEPVGGLSSIDAIAVTHGPGLVGALLVGVQAAKAIAWSLDLPLIGVSHLEGHLLSPFLHGEGWGPPVGFDFPFIALLASGGHTSLYEVRAADQMELIGQTRDDAAGEAYDKVAKMLGLGYPGGPVIDKLATKGDPQAIKLPRPLPKKTQLEFSFSGLKTAVSHYLNRHGIPQQESAVADVCASFQHVAVDQLVRKSIAACKVRDIARLVITGGVAANRGLRAAAADACAQEGIDFALPSFATCTDNAAMIGYAGALRLARGERSNLSLPAFSRDPGFRRGKVPASEAQDP